MTQGIGIKIPPMETAGRPNQAEAAGYEPAFNDCDLLSIDVEDYFQVEAFAGGISRSDWPQFRLRVRRNTERILDLLAEFNQAATFFVLGWVAEREPALVRDIAAAGHELGCHSHFHRRVFTLTPAEFREDLRRARQSIEDAGGQPVSGYRAPTFSIRADSLWALEIMAEEGLVYDSSIFPIHHDLYGMPDAPRFIHEHALANGASIVEVPPSTVCVFETNLGVAGGGYLRHLPMIYTRWGMRRIRRERQPVNVYFHPWEIDPEQPRLAGSWKSRLRHYRGLHKTEPRLRQLLANGQFEPILHYVRRWQKQQEALVS
jgi:polysaccharide deacetylase family protein (PEP-CTERM system associated)